MALGSFQSLTEMSTKNLPEGKGRPARKTDNITAICDPVEMRGPRRPVTGIALLLQAGFEVFTGAFRLWSPVHGYGLLRGMYSFRLLG
jgi:hypothetical protein